MSDPFDIQRIGPPTTDGIPRTSKKHTGIQKQDIATESTPDAAKRLEKKNRREGNHKERKTKDTPEDSEDRENEGVIDIVI